MTEATKEQPEIKPIYIKAVEKIIASLYDSDWITVAGSDAWSELEDYKLDMALDIQRVVEGDAV